MTATECFSLSILKFGVLQASLQKKPVLTIIEHKPERLRAEAQRLIMALKMTCSASKRPWRRSLTCWCCKKMLEAFGSKNEEGFRAASDRADRRGGCRWCQAGECLQLNCDGPSNAGGRLLGVMGTAITDVRQLPSDESQAE